MRRAMAAIVVGALCSVGCPSAYQQTYDRELNKLESQERARQAAENAAHAEAQKYVAIVYFNVGSSMISEEGYRELLWFVDHIRVYPQAQVDVKGYADSTGPEQFNQQLSEQRAKAVADYLVQQGIPATNVATAGFSSNFPDQSNETTHGRSRNRRVEVSVR